MYHAVTIDFLPLICLGFYPVIIIKAYNESHKLKFQVKKSQVKSGVVRIQCYLLQRAYPSFGLQMSKTEARNFQNFEFLEVI
jgi:hypothetical protein